MEFSWVEVSGGGILLVEFSWVKVSRGGIFLDGIYLGEYGGYLEGVE